MTINNEVIENKKRSVSELLQLNTFQGMSDEEIQSLIDFYKEQSFNVGKTEGFNEGMGAKMDEIITASQAARDKAEAAFNAAVNSVVKMESVNNG